MFKTQIALPTKVNATSWKGIELTCKEQLLSNSHKFSPKFFVSDFYIVYILLRTWLKLKVKKAIRNSYSITTVNIVITYYQKI